MTNPTGFRAITRSRRNAGGNVVLPPAVRPRPRAELFSVLLVADHPPLREAISARLRAMGAGPVYQAASVAEARARAEHSGPCDLAVLDLGLPDGGGLDLVAELRSRGWRQIVALGCSDDPHTVREVFQAGAQGYLLKSASGSIVTDGVQRAGPVSSDEFRGVCKQAVGNTPNISPREIQVLQLTADGLTNKEIGQALNLSALTVKSHLSRSGRKLGAGERAQMVALAMRAGVIR